MQNHLEAKTLQRVSQKNDSLCSIKTFSLPRYSPNSKEPLNHTVLQNIFGTTSSHQLLEFFLIFLVINLLQLILFWHNSSLDRLRRSSRPACFCGFLHVFIIIVSALFLVIFLTRYGYAVIFVLELFWFIFVVYFIRVIDGLFGRSGNGRRSSLLLLGCRGSCERPTSALWDIAIAMMKRKIVPSSSSSEEASSSTSEASDSSYLQVR